MGYDATDHVEMPPVQDWLHDWDWLDEQWGSNAIDIWNAVREQCPVATTERYGRAFMPVTMEAVSAVANDTEHFSSAWVNVGRPDAPRRPAPPITSDPPDHHGHRRLLLPAFSPKKVAPMEGELREFCRGLIAGLDGQEAVDAVTAYTQHIPVHGICQLTGIPEEDADLFRDWIFRNFQLAPRDNAVRVQVATEMRAYIDVILHDRLVSEDVLALARRDAERIEVGKENGLHHTTQDGIHALMLEHARAGKRVVRLKGGDPFVFGRGGEELEFLRAHGIAYEVVPGISAALACAAYAGVPLTHRDLAQSLQFVTAHSKSDAAAPDWKTLARPRQTLVVYMGVANLESWRDGLIEHGRDPATPFALVENGSRAEQRVVVGPLAELPERARAHALRSPALLILGETAALAERLHWFGSPPLGGQEQTASFAEAA